MDVPARMPGWPCASMALQRLRGELADPLGSRCSALTDDNHLAYPIPILLLQYPVYVRPLITFLDHWTMVCIVDLAKIGSEILVLGCFSCS